MEEIKENWKFTLPTPTEFEKENLNSADGICNSGISRLIHPQGSSLKLLIPSLAKCRVLPVLVYKFLGICTLTVPLSPPTTQAPLV